MRALSNASEGGQHGNTFLTVSNVLALLNLLYSLVHLIV